MAQAAVTIPILPKSSILARKAAQARIRRVVADLEKGGARILADYDGYYLGYYLDECSPRVIIPLTVHIRLNACETRMVRAYLMRTGRYVHRAIELKLAA